MDFSVGAKGFAMYRAMSLKSAMMTMPVSHRRARAGGNSQTRTLTLDREITLPSSGTTLISLVDGRESGQRGGSVRHRRREGESEPCS
ncbi:putative phage tail component [Escherichia coli 2749250]|nr:hypothetical protein [Escherichia coli]EMW68928.1 putative phage tail component [Escherichia coli 2749250]